MSELQPLHIRNFPVVLTIILVFLASQINRQTCLAQTNSRIGGRTAANLFEAQHNLAKQVNQKRLSEPERMHKGIFEISIPWDYDQSEPGERTKAQKRSPRTPSIDNHYVDEQKRQRHESLLRRALNEKLAQQNKSTDEVILEEDGIGGKFLRAFVFRDDCTSFTYSADSRLIYCGLIDGGVKVVDISTGIVRDQFQLGLKPINALGVTADGKRLAAGSIDSKTIFVRDLSARKTIAKHVLPDPVGIWGMKLSPDTGLVAVCGYYLASAYSHSNADGPVYHYVENMDPMFYVYDTKAGTLVFQRRGSLRKAYQPWLPGRKLLLDNGNVWNIQTKKFVRAIPFKSPDPYTVAPDGLIARESYNSPPDFKEVLYRLYTGSTGRAVGTVHVAELDPSQGILEGSAMSPDSRFLAAILKVNPKWPDNTYTQSLRLISLKNGTFYSLPKATFATDPSVDSASSFNHGLVCGTSGNAALQFSPDQRLLTGMVRTEQSKVVLRTWQIAL